MMDYTDTKRIVLENFICNPVTGDVIRAAGSNRVAAGAAVGHRLSSGYMAVTLPGIRRKVYCHHVVFFLGHGIWAPEAGMMIDHINQVRDDNRIENLRLATALLNANNTDLPSGASAYRTKGGIRYRAQVMVNGVRTVRAGFSSPGEASDWYWVEKARRLTELVS